MRYSKLFGQTIKTVPKDAMMISHRLLWKGGFIRRFSVGRWGFLPLGMRVCQKICRIIEEEMDLIGGQRLEVPTLHPIEIWQATGRDQAFGEEMLIVNDHHGAAFAIGATAEGMMVELVKMFSPSYKDLPIEIYQFSQKFRDDKRPRGGLIRVREFMMKDAYNFCASEKQFMKSYQRFYGAYLKIAGRLGLKVTPVFGDSGAIGGNLSHEFMVESKDGDQSYFVCDQCGYAANVEKAEFKRELKNPKEKKAPFKIVDQPEWVCTMEDNLKHYSQPAWRYLKNVVYKDEKGRIIVASIRGDQEVNETKLKRAAGAISLEPAADEDLKKMGTKSGWVHSWGHKGVIYIGDPGLKAVHNFIGGQKEKTTDSFNVNYGRDFKYKIIADIVNAENGDLCAFCPKGKLKEKKGIEWGHTFKIDHFYTEPQQGYFVDKDGGRKPMWMGSYGIGIGRSMATIVETHHDEKGIVWPEAAAPFKYHLLGLDLDDKEVKSWAEKVYQTLVDKGVEILFDDREGISPGEKFNDADLLGIPWRLVVGKKAVAAKKVELKGRQEKSGRMVELKTL